MFTGIIQAMGTVTLAEGRGKTLLSVRMPEQWSPRLALGSSVAVNGVCLTLMKRQKNALVFELLEETKAKTILGQLHDGDQVNLESSLRLGDEVGGHFVFGHVDGVGEVVGMKRDAKRTDITIRLPRPLMRYVVPQGSIALNGVSLTVARYTATTLTVSLISFTLKETTLGSLRKGDRVNVECDMLAKYAQKR